MNWEADNNAKDSGPNRGTSCSLQQRLGCGARVVREPAETRGGAALAHGRFRASVGAKPGIGDRTERAFPTTGGTWHAWRKVTFGELAGISLPSNLLIMDASIACLLAYVLGYS